MQLLKKCLKFWATKEEMKTLWISYCRSILEQSSVVWDSSLTQENIQDLERTQKSFCKMILKDKYKSYVNSLDILNLQSLSERRKVLSLKFAKYAVKKENMNQYFQSKKTTHDMMKRNQEKYHVNYAKTKRLQNSAIINMQQLLNEDTAT